MPKPEQMAGGNISHDLIDKPEIVLGVNQEKSAGKTAWRFRSYDERRILHISQKFGLSDIMARIIAGRDIDDDNIALYLEPKLRDLVPDPLHLLDMDKAISRLQKAIYAGETIGILGDYDVDGATSSALLVRYLQAINIKTKVHIPDRTKEGYGPNIAAFLKLQGQGCNLIITVDCGAVAFDSISAAKDNGIDIIVLDHHIGSLKLPDAVAVVNPNRLDEESPYKYLAAVGVVFLTLVGLNRFLREAGYFSNKGLKEPDLKDLLDLVALGTICDVVPIKGLNRALVTQGLEVMSWRKNPGLKALMDIAGMNEKPSTYHAGFIIGPRINAGGRVGESTLGYKILSTQSQEEAKSISIKLDEYNIERKAIEQTSLEEAEEKAIAQQLAGRKVICVAGEGWHEGVIGIIAGRIKEKTGLPSAVLALNDGIGKASARSVPGVDFGAAVVSAREEGMLIAGGGHAMAAGFSVSQENISNLHDYLEARLKDDIEKYEQSKSLSIDAIISANALTPELAMILKDGEPYGMGNPAPRVVVANARIRKIDILKEQHIKLMIQSDDGGAYAKAIAFRAIGTSLGEMLISAANGRLLHLAGKVKLDTWNQKETVSLHIEDAGFG